MRRKILFGLVIAILPLAVALYAVGCASANPIDDGGTAQDAGGTQDTGGACTPGCAGKKCGDDGCGGSCGSCGDNEECKASACVPKGEEDAGTSDAGQEEDTGTAVDAGQAEDTGAVTDAGAQDTGTVADTGTVTDAGSQDTGGGGEWPPSTPWFEGTACKLPACDANAAETINVTGSWEHKLTTDSHTCNKLLETFDARMKPGNVQTVTEAFIQKGECLYSDQVGGTVNGVIKGNIAITCNIEPPQQGVTIVVTSVVTFTGGTAVGDTTGHLSGVPVAPAECEVKYTDAFTKK